MKKQRDVFGAIFERLCEPAYSMGWTPSEAESWFTAVMETWPQLEVLDEKIRNRYDAPLRRIIVTVRVAVLRFSEAWLRDKNST